MPATVIAERIGWTSVDPGAARSGGRAAPVVRAAGSVSAHRLLPGRARPVRSVAARRRRSRSGHGQAAKLWVIAGVCGFSRFIGGWMIPTRQAHDVLGGHLEVLGQFGALPRRVVWDQEGAIGQWRGGKQVLHRRVPVVPGHAGDRRPAVPARRPRSEGSGRAGQRLLRDELPAGPPLRVGRRLQRPVHRLAAPSQPAHPRHHEGPSGRGDLRRPRVDAGVPAGAARPVAALQCPPAPGSLRAGRHLRLLGQPALHRPPRRRARHPHRGGRHLRRRRGRPPPPLPRRPPDPDPCPSTARSPAPCASSRPSPTSSPPPSSSNATSPSTTGRSDSTDGRHRTRPSRPAMSPTCAGR